MLVFFVGHGITRLPAGGDREGYLLPTEASHNPTSWLPEAEIIGRS